MKTECSNCGKEYALFDSRYNGYDGVMGEHSAEKLEYQPNFKLKCADAVSLKVKIENDPSLDDFNMNTGLDFDNQKYSDSFSWIIVYKINDKGKKTKILDFETA